MKRREPKQVNTSAASEDYRLEDILREFGGETKNAPAKPDKVSDGTTKFTPVNTGAAADVPDAPTKIAKPKASPVPDKPQAASDTRALPSTDELKREMAKTRPLPNLDAISAEPKAPPKKLHLKRKAAETPQPEPPRIRLEPAAPPAEPQALLRRCANGLHTLRLRVILLALFALIQLAFLACSTLPNSLPPVLLECGGWFVLALTAISMLLSYETFLTGMRDLLHLRISFCTLALPICTLSIVHAVQVLPAMNYCPAATLFLLFLQRMLLSKRSADHTTLRTVCGFDSPMGIFDAPLLLKGEDSLRRDNADMGDFLCRLQQNDLTQTIRCIYATVLLPLTGLLALLLSQKSSGDFVLSWLLLLLGSVPFAAVLSYARPYRSLAKRLSGFGGALCGWQSAKIFGGKHTIILRDADLFPQANITSNGMKLYGEYRADRVIAYALAALEKAQSPLAPIFEGLLRSEYGKRRQVSAFRLYDDDGIGAEIEGNVVLVGTLGFMRSMGVHMPNGARVRQAVYVSIRGELAGVFAVKYKPSASTRKGLRDILANRNFSVVLATRDFLISPELIAAKYELETDDIIFPKFRERVRLSETDGNTVFEQGALIAKDTFGAFATTVAAGRTLRITGLLSLSLCLLVGALGLLICCLLIAWDSVHVASPLHMAAFQILWAAVNSFVTFLTLRF